MRNTQEHSCYGSVSNQNPHLPTLLSSTDPTVFPVKTTDDDASRSKRLFGREGVLVSICGGPCAKRNVIEMAFADGAVAL